MALFRDSGVSVSSPAAQAGRTLVELMVAVVIGLAIVVGLVSLYLSSNRAARASSATAGAEFAGNVLMTLMGDAIKQAGYGEIIGADTTVRSGQTLFDGNGVIGCEAGRFRDPAAGDFSCVPALGDALAVRFQADSVASPEQGALRDCLGSPPPMVAYNGIGVAQGTVRPLVANAYWLNDNGQVVCRGNGTMPAGSDAVQPLIGDVEEFKVFYGFDQAAFSLPQGMGNAAPSAGAFLGANAVRALAGSLNPWDYVVSVYVCVRVRTRTDGAVAAQTVYTGQICPRNAAEVSGMLPTASFADGAVRRVFVQLFTVRSQATSNPLVGLRP